MYIRPFLGVTGQVLIGGDLAGTCEVKYVSDSPPQAPPIVITGALTGTLILPSDFAPHFDVSIGSVGSLYEGGTVEVHDGLLNGALNLSAGSIPPDGLIEVTGNVGNNGALNISTASPLAGTVVADSVTGSVQIEGGVASGGVVEVDEVAGYEQPGGEVGGGTIEIDTLAGTLHVLNDVQYRGGITVADARGTLDIDGAVTGYLHFGDLSGQVDIAKYLGDANDPEDQLFKGHVRVDDRFARVNPSDAVAKIWVHQLFDANDPNLIIGPSSYITVGWVPDDEPDWLSGSLVVIGTAPANILTRETRPSRGSTMSRRPGATCGTMPWRLTSAPVSRTSTPSSSP